MKKHSCFDELLKHRHFLLNLSNSNNKERKQIIKSASKRKINIILNCIVNVLEKNLNLPQEQLEKLKKFKSVLRRLANKEESIETKKQVLVQKGGFLQFLIPAVISGITSIVSSLISNNKSE